MSPDGAILFAGNEDGVITLWDAGSGRELCRLVTWGEDAWAVVDDEGRFDTGDLEKVKDLYWLMPDDPFTPLPVEIFMREYYEPALLPRILAGEQFEEIRPLSNLNRAQPTVKIVGVTPEAGDASRVAVSVEVLRGRRAYKVDKGEKVEETGAYNLRLFRDGQLGATLRESLSQSGQYETVSYLQLLSDHEQRDGERVLTESRATKENIRQTIRELTSDNAPPGSGERPGESQRLPRVTPDDLVLILFSGHGVLGGGGVFYLIPYDTGKGTNFEEVLRHSISSEELSLWLRGIDADELVLVVDACYSAATVQQKGFKPGPLGSRGLGQMAYDKGMRVLASTHADDVALESHLIKQGLLSYALAQDGLSRGQADFDPEDGVITLSEWLNYPVRRVPELYAEMSKTRERGAGDASGRDLSLSTEGEGALYQEPVLFDFSKRASAVIIARGRDE